MKKFIFVFLLFGFNAYAADFINTLGAECSYILYNINSVKYPTHYDIMKPRNSQFWALKKCLDTYKDNGGNIDELNKKYEIASHLNSVGHMRCVTYEDETSQNNCHKLEDVNFRENLTLSISELEEQVTKLKK